MITAIDWRLNLEFLFRLALAGACGAAIGYERLNRLKSAGLRTHFIVAIASALMMIVSKYAYFDVVSEAVKLDPSRVAAGIVSGVSFLGAGMIFRRNQSTVTG
ncbi:MAG: MgtC/SapB family protein, partial [Butyricicoccus pullicaecorum]